MCLTGNGADGDLLATSCPISEAHPQYRYLGELPIEERMEGRKVPLANSCPPLAVEHDWGPATCYSSQPSEILGYVQIDVASPSSDHWDFR